MVWKVRITATAEKQLQQLDREIQRKIVRFLRQRIATEENPRRFGRALRGEMRGFWRYRIMDYRLICQIKDETLVVLVLEAGHRKAIYR